AVGPPIKMPYTGSVVILWFVSTLPTTLTAAAVGGARSTEIPVPSPPDIVLLLTQEPACAATAVFPLADTTVKPPSVLPGASLTELKATAGTEMTVGVGPAPLLASSPMSWTPGPTLIGEVSPLFRS